MCSCINFPYSCTLLLFPNFYCVWPLQIYTYFLIYFGKSLLSFSVDCPFLRGNCSVMGCTVSWCCFLGWAARWPVVVAAMLLRWKVIFKFGTCCSVPAQSKLKMGASGCPSVSESGVLTGVVGVVMYGLSSWCTTSGTLCSASDHVGLVLQFSRGVVSGGGGSVTVVAIEDGASNVFVDSRLCSNKPLRSVPQQ